MLPVLICHTDGNGNSNVVDIFDVKTGAWTTAALSVARSFLSATSLPNDGVAIFAGGKSALRANFLFDSCALTSVTFPDPASLPDALRRRHMPFQSCGHFPGFGQPCSHSVRRHHHSVHDRSHHCRYFFVLPASMPSLISGSVQFCSNDRRSWLLRFAFVS